MKKLLVILGVSLLLGSCTVDYDYQDELKASVKSQISTTPIAQKPDEPSLPLYPSQSQIFPRTICGKINGISTTAYKVNIDDYSTNTNVNWYYVTKESYDALVANPQQYGCVEAVGRTNGGVY